MVDLVVGCPVANRDWCLERWFDAVEASVANTGVSSVIYGFVVSDEDKWTVESVLAGCEKHDRSCFMVNSHESEVKTSIRSAWSFVQYEHMTLLRNMLLAEVRRNDPTYFWSLDSDIIASPLALLDGLQVLDDMSADAVGMKCNMDQWNTPNYGMMSQGGIYRPESDGVFRVDFLMASKLMTFAAYNVDYMVDVQGEDIGWSKGCARAGLKLYWSGATNSVHLLERDDYAVNGYNAQLEGNY